MVVVSIVNILQSFFRYPKVTTDLVDQLSFGVIQEFRESRKNILKRTFVSGSDAAESKVNRKGIPIKACSNSGNLGFRVIIITC